MKSFLSACAAALIIALSAWLVLGQIQVPVDKAFTTSGARL